MITLLNETPDQTVGGLPALTGAEFRIARQDLGLTTEWIAEQLGVAHRTVQRWNDGVSRVSAIGAEQMTAWTEYADAQIDAWVERITDETNPVLVVPRVGEHDGWPASWWCSLAARIIEAVPGCRAVYAEDREPL